MSRIAQSIKMKEPYKHGMLGISVFVVLKL